MNVALTAEDFLNTDVPGDADPEPRLCKDCRFYAPELLFWGLVHGDPHYARCERTRKRGALTLDLVSGKYHEEGGEEPAYCRSERKHETFRETPLCGRRGRFWQSR